MGIGLSLFIGLFFAIGIAIAGWGAYSAFKGVKAAHWPLAKGTLESCEIKESSGSESVSYRVHASYSYEVSGQSYHGDRIAFGYSGSGNHAEQTALHAKLSSARTVTVRYNPSNPAESVLSYGFNRSAILLLAFGLTWLLFTTGFAAIWKISSKGDKAMLDRIEVSGRR